MRKNCLHLKSLDLKQKKRRYKMKSFWEWLQAEDYRFSAWLFLRLLGLIYFIAFASLAVQIKGLIGSQGILPVAELVANYPRFIPSLLSFNSSDAFLVGIVYSGMLLAILQIFNILPKLTLAGSWIIYLSLVNVGQDFMSFQWDMLLLETGFLAIFLAPVWENPRKIAETTPPTLFIWLLRWLLFRLMFASGILKVLAGDPTWANLTAMTYHYETQPLPSPLAYYAHQLPLVFQKFSTLMVYFIEIVVPFFYFMPRRLRYFGAFMTIGLQILILLTGNYAFFNWLTIVLSLLLFDDKFWKRPLEQAKRWRRWHLALNAVVAGVMFLVSTGVFLAQFGLARMPMPFAPYHIANNYGLFVIMTIERPQLIIEGSYDGENWQAYRLRWQPQDLDEAPPIVAPHHPRLDWQLWFAALSSVNSNRWILNIVDALKAGSPDVLALFEASPFPPDKPPNYIRIQLYDYHFGMDTWWERSYRGDYFISR
jgi:lipase maturation factor 1